DRELHRLDEQQDALRICTSSSEHTFDFGASDVSRDAESLAAVLRTAVRVQRGVLRSAPIELDTASDALRRQVRRVLAPRIGDLRLQRPRIQAECGGALGVPARIDAVPCMDAGSVRLQRLARHARLDGYLSVSVQAETGQYVPGQDELLAEQVGTGVRLQFPDSRCWDRVEPLHRDAC